MIVLFVPFATPVPPWAGVTAAAVLSNVPLVGNVTAVVPVTVNVVPKLPEMVIVLAALFATPVPPLTGDKTPVKLVIVLDEILTKSLDTEFQAIIHFSPLITVTPVVGHVCCPCPCESGGGRRGTISNR